MEQWNGTWQCVLARRILQRLDPFRVQYEPCVPLVGDLYDGVRW